MSAPTLRARLTFWYSFVLAVPLIGFSVASDYVLERILLSRTDHFITDGIAAFSSELTSEMQEHAQSANPIVFAISEGFYEVHFPDLRIVMLDSTLAVVGVSTPFPRPAAHSDSVTPPIESRKTLDVTSVVATMRQLQQSPSEAVAFTDAAKDFRVNSKEILLGKSPFVLVGAYPLLELHAVQDLVRKAYFVVVPFLLLCAAVGGYLLAKRGLLPLAAMAQQAGTISATNLHERLPVPNERDELGSLAVVVNRLLERLDKAFGAQRRFVADASHELRTPIAILQSEIDITLARPQRTNEEYRASAEVMRDASRRLHRIVEELFLVSRADAGHLVVRREPLDLEAVVDDSVRSMRQLAAAHGVRIDLRPLVAAPFKGDADLLGRLLLNLLDNAIKHCQKGGCVTIELSHRGKEYAISVIDDGMGIPPEAQPHIFERFYRVDAARSRVETSSTSGAGLGLAIGRWIAEAHDGSLDLVESRPGRTEFRATLPAQT